MATNKRVHQMTIKQFEAAFPDEDHCRAYLARYRWPNQIYCPRCGSTKVGELTTRAFNWQCYDCAAPTSYRFTVLVGTIFENTNKPLTDWFRVIHTMLTSKKGVSALQIMRVMGFGSYKTAHYMCHRIRAGLANEEFRRLMGVVEVDETYVGGKDHNKHWDKRQGRKGTKGKAAVIGAVERKGNVVARVIDRVDGATIGHFLRETLSAKVSLLASDDASAYHEMDFEVPRGVVNHSAKQYVVGAIHTNTIEGFWSLIKRGIIGNYHKVSKKYLPLYVAEFCFRYNNRENADIFG
ncbi:MAG: IS1595 family transposase, partial [Proteobacteria bacterium]|nr:IS1595 family transposase [Pseudomonadota bacterium]